MAPSVGGSSVLVNAIHVVLGLPEVARGERGGSLHRGIELHRQHGTRTQPRQGYQRFPEVSGGPRRVGEKKQ